MSLLKIKLTWDREFSFSGKLDLDSNLEAAEGRGEQMPDTEQQLETDPRLFESLLSFKDYIRRKYNCEKLRMNIRSLELKFQGGGSMQRTNVLTKSWDHFKSTLDDPSNKDISMRVLFEALDDDDDEIYESFEPPPAMTNYFDTSSGDVQASVEALKEMTEAALNNCVPELERSGVGAGMPAFLDLAFGCGGSANDIGSPPDPNVKFPKPSDKKEKLAWYDGYDVDDPIQRRKWQIETLKLATKNCTVTKAKVDKLPGNLTAAQKEAILKAQENGTYVAIASDGTDVNKDVVSYAIWNDGWSISKVLLKANTWIGQR
jgi:hypothetical protein